MDKGMMVLLSSSSMICFVTEIVEDIIAEVVDKKVVVGITVIVGWEQIESGINNHFELFVSNNNSETNSFWFCPQCKFELEHESFSESHLQSISDNPFFV